MATDTTLRLAQVPGIVGIKDATGNLDRGADLLKQEAREVPRLFAATMPPRSPTCCSARTASSPSPPTWPRARCTRCARRRSPGTRRRRSRINQRLHGPAPEALRRGQSHPREMGARAHGPHRRGHPPAAHAARARLPRNRRPAPCAKRAASPEPESALHETHPHARLRSRPAPPGSPDAGSSRPRNSSVPRARASGRSKCRRTSPRRPWTSATRSPTRAPPPASRSTAATGRGAAAGTPVAAPARRCCRPWRTRASSAAATSAGSS